MAGLTTPARGRLADALAARRRTGVAASSARARARRHAGRLLANASGLLVFAVMFFPVYWMVSTAFKPGREILTLVPHWAPHHPTLANFVDAIHRPYFLSDVRNSVIVAAVTVVLAGALAFLAAVAIARFRFYGRKAFLVVVIGVQMVPLNAMIIPLYLLLNAAGAVDTLPGVIVVYLAWVLPFSVWTLRGFVSNVPRDLEEAAMVDGCTRVGAFVRILLPLVAPGLVAMSIFAFVQAWNEYVVAYVLLSSPGKQTLQVWLASFTTTKGTAWGPLMAASTLTALPVVVFFLVVHRRVASGLTAGAVKG